MIKRNKPTESITFITKLGKTCANKSDAQHVQNIEDLTEWIVPTTGGVLAIPSRKDIAEHIIQNADEIIEFLHTINIAGNRADSIHIDIDDGFAGDKLSQTVTIGDQEFPAKNINAVWYEENTLHLPTMRATDTPPHSHRTSLKRGKPADD